MSQTRPAVSTTIDGGVAVVTLDRAHGNAINGALVDGLLAAFRDCEENPAVGVVVLAAAGKIFCPGLDLQELLPLDRPAMARFLRDR